MVQRISQIEILYVLEYIPVFLHINEKGNDFNRNSVKHFDVFSPKTEYRFSQWGIVAIY